MDINKPLSALKYIKGTYANYILLHAGACGAFTAGIYAPGDYYTIILFWIGGSLTAVTNAYVFKQPDIFRKKQDGSIPFCIRWLFIPFLFGGHLF